MPILRRDRCKATAGRMPIGERAALLLSTVWLAAAAALLALSGGWFERLPRDYRSEVVYEGPIDLWQSPDAGPSSSVLVGRRVDQVLQRSGGVAIVQSTIDWSAPDDVRLYQKSAIFGVDPLTRRNVAGYGDGDRTGYFTFPPDMQPSAFELWDVVYAGPVSVAFERRDRIGDLVVHLYRLGLMGLDDTAWYDFLPDVPERYRLVTDGRGLIWVEPHTGIVVDYTEVAAARFVEQATGQVAGMAASWTSSFAEETRSSQLRLAAAARTRLLMAERWVPAGLAGLGLGFLAMAAMAGGRRVTARPAAIAG